jgi:hypothetical protein
MIKAQEAHINRFAPNIAYNKEGKENPLENAFDATGASFWFLLLRAGRMQRIGFS